MRLRAGTLVALALLVVLWASAFPAIKLGLEGYGPGAPDAGAARWWRRSTFVPFLLAFRRADVARVARRAAFVGLGVVGIACTTSR